MYAAEPSGNESENLFVTIHYRQRELSQGSSLFCAVLYPKEVKQQQLLPFLTGKGGAPVFGHRLFLSLLDFL